MSEHTEPSNIYETHSPADPVPEEPFFAFRLNKSRTITRNRLLTGLFMFVAGFILLFWYVVIYTAPDRGRLYMRKILCFFSDFSPKNQFKIRFTVH